MRASILPMLLLAASAAGAQPAVFRCAGASGAVSYQSTECEDPRAQKQLKIPASPPEPAASASGSGRYAWKAYVPPREAVIVFTYDPREEPVGFSTERMEAAIRSAMAAWMARCQVRLHYAGRAPAALPGTPQRVPIRWEPRYLRSDVAGTGGPEHGIALNVWFREEAMLRVLTHEMGHVLGLPHTHEDPSSIMSYLQHQDARRRGQVSESDYAACNRAMEARFGIALEAGLPAAAPAASAGRMSDQEAMRRLRAQHGSPEPAASGGR